jgi:hypothetical protein
MQSDIPHWKLKGHRYVYLKNRGFKITAYCIAIILFLFAIGVVKSLISALLSGTNHTATGDLIGGGVAALLFLLVGYILFSSANKNDKYIDLKNQTLNLKNGKGWKTVSFSQIQTIVPIEKYINGHYHGVFYAYLLNGQNEPVRNEQEISDTIFDNAAQLLFYTNMKSVLQIKD